MAGINFIARVEEISSSVYTSSCGWTFNLDWDHNKVPHINHIVSPQGETVASFSGGYVGVSLKTLGAEECLLSIGTPAFAISPDLMKWGLKRVQRGAFFVRVDDGAYEEADEERKPLVKEATRIHPKKHIGWQPSAHSAAGLTLRELPTCVEEAHALDEYSINHPSVEVAPPKGYHGTRHVPHRRDTMMAAAIKEAMKAWEHEYSPVFDLSREAQGNQALETVLQGLKAKFRAELPKMLIGQNLTSEMFFEFARDLGEYHYGEAVKLLEELSS